MGIKVFKMKSIFSNILTFRWSIDMKSDLNLIWDLISNTDRINRSFSSNPIDFEILEDTNGGTKLFGNLKSNLGIVSKFREYPFEWIENNYFSVFRVFSKGPLKKMQFKCVIKKYDIGFKVNFLIRVLPSHFLLIPFIKKEINKSMIINFRKTFREVDNFILTNQELAIPVFGIQKKNLDPKEFNLLKEKFTHITKEEIFSTKLSTYILSASDNDLIKIKPYRLAKIINEDKKKTLEFFLKATKEGYFDLNWNILCPECKGSGSNFQTLSKLEEKVHCKSCNIDYGLDFDRNVELTFSPNISIRETFGGIYCYGGPGNTPHIRNQIRVKKNSTKILKIPIKKGVYRVLSPQLKYSTRINVDENSPIIDSIEFLSTNQIIETSAENLTIEINNPNDYEILVKIEKADWLLDVVTASEVTAMQEFRFHFSSDVLRKDQEISIKSIALLFTDLKGSTIFYNKKGDAYAYKIVGDHFDILFKYISEFNGAIVKTIGDAVMAVFLNPKDAVNYSLKVHVEIEKLNRKYGEDLLQLKIGIHFGPALVVNMNDRLDYFGSTVNLAARTEGQCKGKDIVITKKIYDIPGIKELISNFDTEKFESELKGFAEVQFLVRIKPNYILQKND
jgi:adenylate cyclase